MLSTTLGSMNRFIRPKPAHAFSFLHPSTSHGLKWLLLIRPEGLDTYFQSNQTSKSL